ncbi:branched-chain amino acid transaminase [Candidatus Saganbacteria bacterium]|uniref:Branched-chain-amino-acid aminotransferase n=1 Tax=Candidatus Saganbacteria bacterium TaxID=2575572 RepID=A0A9D6YVV6_UNCSA|nr:branched-chain amino acid transaminase [Candidatus Saganbacteria bacterium]
MKYAFFRGEIVPFENAKISIMTHAFNYGTGVFEGIRGYFNHGRNQMYILKLAEHYKRLQNSARALRIGLKYSEEELVEITVELVKRNAYKEDVYIRPIAYKSQEKIGLGLTGVEDDFCMFVSPFGAYLDISKGIKVCVSSWRRIGAQSMPQGAKITGAYFNSSLAKAEALEKGCDEAILLSPEGTVAEGSGENLFLVKDGKLITPPLSEIILPGITRAAIMELARGELKIETEERYVDKEELFSADELFFCGTGAQISPIVEAEGKKIGDGKVGSLTKELQKVYFDAAKGNNPKYAAWVTPAY